MKEKKPNGWGVGRNEAYMWGEKTARGSPRAVVSWYADGYSFFALEPDSLDALEELEESEAFDPLDAAGSPEPLEEDSPDP